MNHTIHKFLSKTFDIQPENRKIDIRVDGVTIGKLVDGSLYVIGGSGSGSGITQETLDSAIASINTTNDLRFSSLETKDEEIVEGLELWISTIDQSMATVTEDVRGVEEEINTHTTRLNTVDLAVSDLGVQMGEVSAILDQILTGG